MGKMYDTVDGCEIHHQKDGWNMLKPKQGNGMFTIYQLVQDFATIHHISHLCWNGLLNRNSSWFMVPAQRISRWLRPCQALNHDSMGRSMGMRQPNKLGFKGQKSSCPTKKYIETSWNIYLGLRCNSMNIMTCISSRTCWWMFRRCGI